MLSGMGATIEGSGSDRRGSEEPSAATGGTLGLPQATALIVGSIIGVGIFNLPGSLAAYGPISLFAMALCRVCGLDTSDDDDA